MFFIMKKVEMFHVKHFLLYSFKILKVIVSRGTILLYSFAVSRRNVSRETKYFRKRGFQNIIFVV